MFQVAQSYKQRLLQKASILNPVTPKLKFAIGFFDIGANFAATLHEANEEGSLGLGKPVSGVEITHLIASALTEEEANTEDATAPQRGWVDSRIIFENTKAVVWVTNPVKRPMWFKVNSTGNKLTPYWPRLLYVASKTSKSLSVFSVARANVKGDTKVYHAPLCNVGNSGIICQGSAHRPAYEGVTDSSFLDGCEAVMYDSYFSHVNHEQTFSGGCSEKGITNTLHVNRWKEIADAGRKVTVKDMVFSGLRVNDILKRLV